MLEFLLSLECTGKIRAFGIATDVPDTMKIIERMPEVMRAVPIPSDALEPNVSRILVTGRLIVLTPLNRVLPQLQSLLLENPEAARRWSPPVSMPPTLERWPASFSAWLHKTTVRGWSCSQRPSRNGLPAWRATPFRYPCSTSHGQKFNISSTGNSLSMRATRRLAS
jgi:hypothetical protein